MCEVLLGEYELTCLLGRVLWATHAKSLFLQTTVSRLRLGCILCSTSNKQRLVQLLHQGGEESATRHCTRDSPVWSFSSDSWWRPDQP